MRRAFAGIAAARVIPPTYKAMRWTLSKIARQGILLGYRVQRMIQVQGREPSSICSSFVLNRKQSCPWSILAERFGEKAL